MGLLILQKLQLFFLSPALLFLFIPLFLDPILPKLGNFSTACQQVYLIKVFCVSETLCLLCLLAWDFSPGRSSLLFSWIFSHGFGPFTMPTLFSSFSSSISSCLLTTSIQVSNMAETTEAQYCLLGGKLFFKPRASKITYASSLFSFFYGTHCHFSRLILSHIAVSVCFNLAFNRFCFSCVFIFLLSFLNL